jgi:integrase
MGQIRKRGEVYWIRYYRNGRLHEESSQSATKHVAIDLLRQREGKIANGGTVNAKMQRFRFDEAAADVLNDYRVNDQASVDDVARRIRKHLQPFFGGRRMIAIGTADVKTYIAHRLAARTVTTEAYQYTRPDGRLIAIPARERTITMVSNAAINRELTILRRMFNLAVENEKLTQAPYVPLLAERNVRNGFFERDQFLAVQHHLPEALQSVVAFAYLTGWRIDSEVLVLRWTHVHFETGEVTLDPYTAKNDEPRTFPMTDDLRALLERQWAAHVALQQDGHICPFVFFRLVAHGRGGPTVPKPIKRFSKAWKTATRAAGCPGRIPHDFRRTAVRNMVRRGVPERVAMQLAGHKTRSVFERYNIVSAADLRTAATQLSGQIGAADFPAHGQFMDILGTADATGGAKVRKNLRK